MSRPTDYPDWATNTNYGAGPYPGQPNKAAPLAGNISEGFDPGSGVPAEWLNWLFNRTGSWFRWLLTLPTTASDAPQYIYQDSAGNARSLVDHNGYPMGRRNEWRQEWNTLTDGRMTVAPDSVINGDVTYPSLIAKKNGGTTNLTPYAARSNMLAHFGFTGISFVLETEIAVSTLAATNTWIFVGLSSDANVVSATNNIGFMYQLSGNWRAYSTSGGVGGLSTDLGVAPAVGTVPTQRLRLEVHGSASPYGSKARFFVNDVRVGEFALTIPSAAMGLWAGSTITGGASSGATDTYIGSTLAAWNRALSIAPL